jgi:hypothetical protein
MCATVRVRGSFNEDILAPFVLSRNAKAHTLAAMQHGTPHGWPIHPAMVTVGFEIALFKTRGHNLWRT